MEELPKHIRGEIYREFVFVNFLYMFRIHFKFTKESKNPESNSKQNPLETYTWEDNIYQQFMIKILESLEPRFYELKELIFKEGEEVNE